MPTVPLPIANGFYRSESLPISAQECVNWYPVIQSAPSLNQENLFGIPGLAQVATTGILRRQGRGAHVMNGVPYFVDGENLFSMGSDYSITNLGVIEGSARCSMADNGTQLMILVPGGKGYIYNHVTTAFAEITDSDFRANGEPQFCCFIDGYFCATTDSKKFIISALNDGTSWAALDFGSAESDPDDIVAPVVFSNQLFIGGGQTFEAFQNIGGAGFPFQRTGLFIQRGVYAPYSLISLQETFLFIGGGANESPAVWALAGNSVQKISTQPIDYLLHLLTADELQSVYAWSYADRGSYFVGFALPDTCIVYDITTQRWHERKSYLFGSQGAYRVSSVVNAYNTTFCSDILDGRIGELSATTYKEYGEPIIRTISTQPFMNEMKSVFFPSLELTVESGVGNDDCPNPVVTLERSLDGKTWGNPRPRPIGRIGQYNRRSIWRKNGRAARFEVFRFTLSDPVKPVIIGLTADVIPGAK